MLQEVGRLVLALGALSGAWAVLTAWTAARSDRDDFLATARRGAIAATACAAAATVLLLAALWRGDVQIAFVAERWSVLVPARFAFTALLGAPGGALPAWAAVAGAAGLFALHAAPRSRAARAWGAGVLGGLVGAPLALAALALRPFGEAHGVAFEGAGLAADLQRGPAVVHAVALLAASGIAAAAFVLTIAALAAHSIGEAWSRAVRPWNAAAFAALVIGAASGARWYAASPLRGDWMEYRGAAPWLITAAIASWLAKLDRGRQPPDRVVMRMLLAVGTFVAGSLAIALLGGSVVRSVTDPVGSAAGFALAIVPVGALAVTVRLVASRGGALGGLRGVADPPRGAAAAAGSWLTRAGVILVAGAAIGSYFARSHTLALGDTEIFRARDPFGHQWAFRSEGVSTLQRENYGSLTLALLPERDGARLPLVVAESRNYFLADDRDVGPTSATAGLIAGPFLETRLAVVEPDRTRPTIHVTFVPLAPWLVPGAVLLALGVLLGARPGARGDA